jgi:hypothetical protein
MAAPRAKRAGEKCAGKPRLQSLQVAPGAFPGEAKADQVRVFSQR